MKAFNSAVLTRFPSRSDDRGLSEDGDAPPAGNSATVPRVRHWVGLPEELSSGSPRRLMQPARMLVMEEKDPGVMLFRYDAAGTFAGDTWHMTQDDAKEQVVFEYGHLVSEWKALPPGIEGVTDLLAFLLREEGTE